MKKSFVGLMFAVVASLLLSCSLGTPDTSATVETQESAILGTWVSDYGEKYVITESSLENYYSDTLTYAGEDVTIVSTDDETGYIYIKYTRSMNSDYSYSETAPDVGKWYALHYKGLGTDSVSLSGAYKADGVSSCATLDEAKTEFTVDNGYFAYYSETEASRFAYPVGYHVFRPL